MTEGYSEFQRNIAREQEFMMNLGQAITEWCTVESACYQIYARLMKGANRHLVSVNFFHIQGFESRLLLLDRCLYFVLGPKASALHWKPLRKRATAQAAIRNQLAHSTYIIEGRGEAQTPTLAPSFFDATAIVRGRAMNPDYRIDGSRIKRAHYEFKVLAKDLHAFREQIRSISKNTDLTKSARSRSSKSESNS